MVDDVFWDIPVQPPSSTSTRQGTESSPSTPDATPPWYPSGLLSGTPDPSTFELGLRTPMGKVYGWDFRDVLNLEWWQTLTVSWWGHWPERVDKVRVVAHTENKIVLALDKRYIVHVYPFQTGWDVSTLIRYAPWKDILQDERVLLPLGGLRNQHGDQMCMFDYHKMHTPEEISANLQNQLRLRQLGRDIGKVHASFQSETTPNAEWRWNTRLKDLEGALNTTTLWRAPHTKHVQGIPPFHLSLDGLLWDEYHVTLVPQPRPLTDTLLCKDERMPAVATIANLEQVIALRGAFNEDASRAMFLASWEGSLPPAWGGYTLRTLKGGLWIWRYEAILHQLARARAFDRTDAESMCMDWLNDVSRIQAKLGVLRMTSLVARLSVFLFIFCVLSIGFAESMEGPFQGGTRIFLANVFLFTAIGFHIYTDNRIPEPY